MCYFYRFTPDVDLSCCIFRARCWFLWCILEYVTRLRQWGTEERLRLLDCIPYDFYDVYSGNSVLSMALISYCRLHSMFFFCGMDQHQNRVTLH